jgi:hypothetical protein
MRFDERPIDDVREWQVDVLVAQGLRGPEELYRLPVANRQRELDIEQGSGAKDWGRLALGVGVNTIRLDVRAVLQEPVQDVERLPDVAEDKVAEQRDVGVRNVIVADRAVPVVADMTLGEQIPPVEVPLPAICRCMFSGAPALREREAVIHVDQGGNYLIALLFSDMPLVNPHNLSAVIALQRPGGLGGFPVIAVGERGRHVPSLRGINLPIASGDQPEEPGPVEPVPGVDEHVRDVEWLNPFRDLLFQLLGVLRLFTSCGSR